MDANTQTQTRNFERDRPIECQGWLEFTILESTYRYWRIRFTAEIDNSDPEKVESEGG